MCVLVPGQCEGPSNDRDVFNIGLAQCGIFFLAET